MNQKHNVTAEKLGIQISSGTLAGLAGGAVTISKGETNLFVSATAAATLIFNLGDYSMFLVGSPIDLRWEGTLLLQIPVSPSR